MKMPGDDALLLLIDTEVSRYQYSLIRQSNPDRFPSYKILQNEKTLCTHPRPLFVELDGS